jgi:hypothetical protein
MMILEWAQLGWQANNQYSYKQTKHNQTNGLHSSQVAMSITMDETIWKFSGPKISNSP